MGVPASTAGLADRRARHARSPGPAPRSQPAGTLAGVSMTIPDDAPEATARRGPATSVRSRQLRWAALDAVVPGMGHLVAGRRRLAILFSAPTLVVLGVLGVIVAANAPARLAAEAVNALAVLLVVQAIVLVWRLLAVTSGLRAAWLGRRPRAQALGAAALIALVVGPQAYLGYVTNVAREEVDRVFSGETSGAWQPLGPPPTVLPSASTGAATTSPSPSLSRTAALPLRPRVNVLLIGIDSGAGRSTAATDTMIVASLDPVSETVSMVSIPRDIVDVPLPDGSRYAPKLNGLDADARHHPSRFPGSDGSGHDVLMAAVGTLLGLRIDSYAAVSLGGFVRVVDVLGGVDVSVSRSLCDPGYDEYGFSRGFSIAAGLRHLSGYQALAYARIRQASGESDFTRAARQQEIISGLRDAVVQRGFVSDPIALLQAVGRSLQTNVAREQLPDLADAMARVDRSRTYRAVISTPLVHSRFDARGSIQVPDVAGIRALAAKLFPPSGTLPAAEFAVPPSATRGGGSGVGNCLAPAPPPPAPPPPAPPPPAPAPTAEPTAAPTAPPTPEPPTAEPTIPPAPTAEPTIPPEPSPLPSPTEAPTEPPPSDPTPSPSPATPAP